MNNTNDRNIKILVNDFTIIKDEREAFEKKKQEKEVEVVDVEKGKKVKLSQEEYENYLLQSKYVEDEDGRYLYSEDITVVEDIEKANIFKIFLRNLRDIFSVNMV